MSVQKLIRLRQSEINHLLTILPNDAGNKRLTKLRAKLQIALHTKPAK